MDNLPRIVKLVQTCGKIDGRKKLQKVVHILKEMGYPFTQDFEFHYYGPYSRELRAEVDTLVRWGVLDEDPDECQGGHTRWTFTPGDQADMFEAAPGESLGLAPEWEPRAKMLAALESQLLEAVSTIMFLGPEISWNTQELKNRFERLKPSLTDRWQIALKTAQELRGESQHSTE